MSGKSWIRLQRRLPVAVCLVTGLWCFCAVGQGARVDPALLQLQSQLSDQRPHTVQGTVVDSVTGEPIYRALVQLGGQSATLTDHEGRFEFEGVTAGGIPAWAMKPGYFADPRPGRLPSTVQGSNAGGLDETPPQQVVKLVPEAVISGTVLGPDGAPLEGIPVQLKTLAISEGLLRWRQRNGTTTDSEGQYRFAELEAGKYAVTSGFHTEGLLDSRSSMAYVPVRNPPMAGGGSADASARAETAIALAAGEYREASLTPEVEKLYPVSGVLAGFGGNRGVSFKVETGSGEEIAPVSRFNARTGEFRLMLPSGTFQVTATTGYLPQGPMEARREITVPQAPVSGVSLVMEAYATVPVEVVRETVDQSGDAGAQAAAMAGMGGVNINLVSADGTGGTPYISAQPLRRQPGGLIGNASADPGPLILDNISPGRYVLQAQPNSPWYVASATCGNIDLTQEQLAVGGGSVGCSVRVVLRNDLGIAHVTMRNPGGTGGNVSGEGTLVYLLPVGDLIRQPVTGSVGYSGSESYQVAPGRYLVLALDHREELAYRDPETMRRYASLGQEIVVTPNGKIDAEVGLTHGAP